MGVRETLNKKKPLVVAGTVVVFAIAIGTIFWSSSSGLPGPITSGFYSDDDGKTWFKDDAGKICPFDHDGKQAVQAHVFQYGSGKPFVGYLSRLNDNALKKALSLKNAPLTAETGQALSDLLNNGSQVKRPGELKWQVSNSPGAGAVLNLVAPPGETGDLNSVDP